VASLAGRAVATAAAAAHPWSMVVARCHRRWPRQAAAPAPLPQAQFSVGLVLCRAPLPTALPDRACTT
jgi:hypothetical protein